MSSLTLVTVIFLLVAVLVAVGIVVMVALPNVRTDRARERGAQDSVRAPRGHSSRTGQRRDPPPSAE